MKKRRSITYVEPTTLGDLRQIVEEAAGAPPETRVWIRHNGDGSVSLPLWYSIEVSQSGADNAV